jgi:hypothetical protein
MAVSDPVGILISIFLMAAVVVASAGIVLHVRPLPYWKAILIAAVSVLLGKLFVSILHWPSILSYTIPTIACQVLSYVFFKPTILKFLLYWAFGFALYLAIHLTITALFGWTFMFPFWVPKLLG